MSNPNSTNIPYGYCNCGCGEKTNIAPSNDAKSGYIKGRPLRFIRGHQRRSHLSTHYKAEDRGYGTPCWIWQLGTNANGYGTIRRNGSPSTAAHRWYYEQRFGPIPDGLLLHHLCENTACVNPDHLQTIERGAHTSLHVRGKRKLDEQRVAEMRALYATGNFSQSELGRRFGVTQRMARLVVLNELWKPRHR